MTYTPLGLRYPDGGPLGESIQTSELAVHLAGTALEVERAAGRSREARLAFQELEPKAAVDPGDPVASGWTFVVSDGAPELDQLIARLRPLAEHRRMADPAQPLRFPGGRRTTTADWIDQSYLGLGSARPRYVLLAGGPKSLPFTLQSELGSAGAAVGRVAFDSLGQLSTYVDKVLLCEDPARDPRPARSAVVFATDGGKGDPTHYSARYLAEPIASQIEADGRFEVVRIFGSVATKPALLHALDGTTPALVFTASHGFFASPQRGLADQRRVNGALACQGTEQAPLGDWMLSADDLPLDRPVCPGGIVIQFACWSYGTPTDSSFTHWRVGRASVTASEPFLAAIPQRLLSHPDGPIGFIGHVDTAWLHGFDDPARPIPGGDYHPRAEAFRSLVARAMLDRTAAGFGLEDLQLRASTLSSAIATRFDKLRRLRQGVNDLDAGNLATLVDLFVRRNDAMNFFLLGDPGARLRVR